MDAEKLREIYNDYYTRPEDHWSDTNLLHTDLIIKRIVKYISDQGFKIGNDKKVLDIGCAKGHHTESFRKAGFEAFGFDYSDIAVGEAKRTFPKCSIFFMDGFNPQLNENFDIIFMKGFSGTNTHDLDFVANMCNKYVRFLNNKGWFILAFSSNFSGIEVSGETVNWTRNEIKVLSSKLPELDLVNIKYFSHSNFKRIIRNILNIMGLKRKQYFYLMYLKK